MKSIYELQQIANNLRSKTETDSISPEDTFGLQSDVLAYMADMEQNVDGLGIRKVYKTKTDLEADKKPIGTNGKPLRYGQLVIVYDSDNTTYSENGNIYAWQRPGWQLVGNISNIYELKEKIKEEAVSRADADNALNGHIDSLQQQVNTLVGENASEAIDNFQEVIAFLGGIKDKEQLTALLESIRATMSSIGADVQTNSDDIRVLKDSVGEPEGIAPLDADGLVPAQHLPRQASSVLPIGGTVKGITVMPGMQMKKHTDEGCAVVYNEDTRTFVLRYISPTPPVTVGYYSHWLDSALFLDDEGKPRGGKIFVDGATLWVWNPEKGMLEETSGGKIKAISLNGKTVAPDAEGNVALTVDEMEVDESLDAESTNPVENRAVAAKLSEIEGSTLFDSDVEEDDEGKQTVTLKNKSGAAITQFTLAAGGGGGDAATTKIVLGASVSRSVVKEDGECVLTYSYDHQNVGGDESGQPTGQKAKIEIRVLRGSILVYGQQTDEVGSGTYTLDVSNFLQVGTTDIYVKATTTDPNTGNVQTKQAYVSVKVVSLSLVSGYSLSNGLGTGGYDEAESAVIPYTVQGTGTKVVSLYLDGEQHDAATVTRSGTTNGSFSIAMGGLIAGRHTVQLVAEMEASEELTLRSESIYFDIFKAGSTGPLIGTKHVFKDGRIFTTDHLTPRLEAGQYEQLTFEYAVYDAGTTPAPMSVWQNGEKVLDVSVPRSTQQYSNRFTVQGEQAMKLVSGATEYPFSIDVRQSSIDVSEATYGLELKLSAAGRSNEESDPGHWEYGAVKTSFEKVDWKSSGWTGESLKLMNGAKAHIDFRPFVTDAATNGFTIEVEMKVSNVTDKDYDVVSCMDGNKGFQITGDKAMMYTGSTKEVEDEDGNKTTQPVGVGRQYDEDTWVKLAFVIGRRADGRLMELYVDGKRAAADIYGDSDNFMQAVARGIDISSDGADVEVRIIRAYNRALTDDEEMDNHIVDQRTLDKMAKLFEENDVLSEDGRSIDFGKLRKKGKAIMLVVRKGGLGPVNAENNKKTDFLADVHLWLPDGRYIYLKNVYIRIQGTSSTKYPTKNYRIYCAKGENPEMYIDGVKQTELAMELRIGQKKVKILCAKADYSDSSMAQNTGGAKLWNDMMTALGFLTPPQKVDSRVRTAVDGYPIDVFSAESMEETPEYYGQYNLNHDKSDWQEIIGLEGVDGFTTEQPIAFEFLNNTQPLCLFQGQNDLDAQAAAEFDNALEFNYPAKTGGDDTKWANCTAEQKAAFKRLWGWIRDCVPSGADPDDLSTFVSAKFKNEVGQYFDKNFLLCWWLFTDFHANVDQKVKNLILATWDALIWYFIYYDGDTQLGDRNDSMLAYLYDVMRETWDAEKNKYAFEGHDSWLWCLVLANMQDEIKAMAQKMREKLTLEEVNRVFDEEQQANWCGRVYNKSGEIKYIKPQTEGVETSSGIVKYPYIYALKGDKKAFRHWFLKNRFALLDAKYETGNFLSDNIDMYMTRQATAPANTIDVVSNELYYFGYGTNNSPHLQASEEAEKGETVTLRFQNAFTVNDPIRIYGASRMAELDMRGAADNLTGDLNLNKCKVLRRLDISTAGSGSSGWCIVLDQCRHLSDINLNGQTNARTGTLSSTELDLRNQGKLKTLDARGVSVQAVLLAQGCPLAVAHLGGSIQTLRLEYLPELEEDGLTLEDWSTVRTVRMAGCPKMSWQTILTKCANVERVRIEGIDMEDDGKLLERYKSLKGVDASGSAVGYCALVGRVRLTRCLTDEEWAEYHDAYPELVIVEPEWTVVQFNDDVSASANISNLDNRTGYEFDNKYAPSGHVARILARRHRCLAKKTAEGEMTIFPLHDEDSNYFADADDVRNATPAVLTGEMGDVVMYEPHYWYKGVNDFVGRKKYALYSSNEECPHATASVRIEKESLRLSSGSAISVAEDKGNVSEAIVGKSGYSKCSVDVAGYKQVRFPSVVSEEYGAIMTDADGRILSRINTPDGIGIISGMYVYVEIPPAATTMYFTIEDTAPFDHVLLIGSNEMEAVEPDWVEHEACLTGVFEACLVNDALHSYADMLVLDSLSWLTAKNYGEKRGKGFRMIDYEMHKDVANLFFAKYGERDCQGTCGRGGSEWTRALGLTIVAGMTDTTANTDNPTEETAYLTKEDITKNIISPNMLGYENWYSCKAEFMLMKMNEKQVDYILRSVMPDGTERKLENIRTYSSNWTKNVAHGRYMDVVPVSNGGSSKSYYYDYALIHSYSPASVYRSVYRSNNFENGVSFIYTSNNYSSTDRIFSSRMAFRGKIKFASSAAEFIAIKEID